MHKDEFHAKIAPLDKDKIKKILWELYWRGSKDLRQRIETLLDPEKHKKRVPELPDREKLCKMSSILLLWQALVRTWPEVMRCLVMRWLVTFGKLFKNTGLLLTHGDMEYGAPVMEKLIDLACETTLTSGWTQMLKGMMLMYLQSWPRHRPLLALADEIGLAAPGR